MRGLEKLVGRLKAGNLITWTPANPGEYSGTEPKRFFRTRMVKKP